MHPLVSLFLRKATESEARVDLQVRGDSTITKIQGTLHGPTCDFSHTLPAECPVAWNQDQETGSAEVLLLDPCYWTPALPFQYELDITLSDKNGNKQREKRLVGFRRWTTQGPALFLERRRTVMRGCRSRHPNAELLEEARSAEVALLVDTPSDDLCAAASRWGVSLWADLRSRTDSLDDVLSQLSCHPAVMMTLVTAEQLALLSESRRPLLIAVAVEADATEPGPRLAKSDLFAFELAPGAKPPAWLADSDQPSIAIRCEAKYADLQAGRSACDRLQASLAPDFNLAGYFVSP